MKLTGLASRRFLRRSEPTDEVRLVRENLNDGRLAQLEQGHDLALATPLEVQTDDIGGLPFALLVLFLRVPGRAVYGGAFGLGQTQAHKRVCRIMYIMSYKERLFSAENPLSRSL